MSVVVAALFDWLGFFSFFFFGVVTNPLIWLIDTLSLELSCSFVVRSILFLFVWHIVPHYSVSGIMWVNDRWVKVKARWLYYKRHPMLGQTAVNDNNDVRECKKKPCVTDPCHTRRLFFWAYGKNGENSLLLESWSPPMLYARLLQTHRRASPAGYSNLSLLFPDCLWARLRPALARARACGPSLLIEIVA